MIETQRHYVSEIEKLKKELSKKQGEIFQLTHRLKEVENSKNALAKAYGESIGVIKSKETDGKGGNERGL
jgi:predicted RNase H-like nuclease (RuvC/YqgF family)